MRAFAQSTSVPVDRTKAEVERTLAKYGADQFMYGAESRGAFVAFKAHGRVIRFVIPMPNRDSFLTTPTGKDRTETAIVECLEAEVRRRWRALLLCIKAKLEAVHSGIATFETEFMPYTLLANGRTVAEAFLPEVERALAANAMPRFAGFLSGPTQEGERP